MPCGTDPLDAIQALFDRILHIERCVRCILQTANPGPGYNRPLEFGTRDDIKSAYMVLFLDSVSLDFRI